MSSKSNPEGNTAFYSKWVAGVLTYYRRSDHSAFYTIDGANKTVSVLSGGTFAQEGTQALGDSDALAFGAASDVSMTWDATNFVVTPVADDTGIFKIGNGTLDMDFRVTLGAAGDYIEGDVGAKALELVGDVRLDLSGATVVAGNTDGGVIKGGTSGSPIVEDTANMKFISFYFDNGAASGESNGLYLRQYVTGAGGEGIAARLFQSVTDVAAGNARGAHISLSFAASGSVTGLGAALETTLHIPSGGSFASGTYTALKVAINSDDAASDPAGATELSFIRVDNQGDATGAADVDTDAFLFSLQGFTSGATSLLYDADEGAIAQPNGSIKIKIGANTRYLYFWDGAVTP